MVPAYVATVQIIIHPDDVNNEADACDWFSALLSENHQVLDWQYLTVGPQILSPTETYVEFDPIDGYEEGSAFNPPFSIH